MNFQPSLGTIVTVKELMKKNGLYHKLFHIQQESFGGLYKSKLKDEQCVILHYKKDEQKCFNEQEL